MRKLIVNADDFGLSPGANEAIAELLAAGAITSATLMANGPAFEDALERTAGMGAGCAIGLHANFTQFEPVGGGAGLEVIRTADGTFYGRSALYRAWLTGRLNADALAGELEAQWRKCEKAGVTPSHIDTHQHAHAVSPVFDALQAFAAEKGVPVRRLGPGSFERGLKRRLLAAMLGALAKRNERQVVRSMSADAALVSIFSAGQAPSVAAYRALLEACEADIVELMVHPAKPDAGHRAATGISEVSGRDYEVLSSEAWRNYLLDGGFELVSYRDARAANRG